MSGDFLNQDGRYDRPRCDHPRVELRAQIIATNGPNPYQYKLICLYCDRPTSGALKRSFLIAQGVDLAAVPTWQSDHYRPPVYEPCARCGDAAYTELHHWAPKHLFPEHVTNRHGYMVPEWDAWPTSYLCRSCHEYWHKVVTPTMSQRRAS